MTKDEIDFILVKYTELQWTANMKNDAIYNLVSKELDVPKYIAKWMIDTHNEIIDLLREEK